MRDVLIALVPAFSLSVLVYGLDVLRVTAIAVVSCVLLEYLIQRFLIKGDCTVKNLSAVLTGVLLAFNLPSDIPWWIVVIGSVVAIGVAKMTFGGLGRNPFNPALVGRVFLLIAYPVQMTSFPKPITPEFVDAFAGATPLAALKTQAVELGDVNFLNMLSGVMPGSLGEISAISLLVGGIYMIWRKVITWHIPVAVLGSMAVFAFVVAAFTGGGAMLYELPAFHLLAGGAMLGAIFMATDYVTSPMTKKGMLIYGVGVGVITMIIRQWGAYPEGMSFAILLMNAVTPLINKYVKPKRFGVMSIK
jgi:electron transport complex protein RnfD